MAENILNLEHLHELVEQELDNAIKFIEREKKKRARNDKIRKKLKKQANEIGMTLKPREPTDEENDERNCSGGLLYCKTIG
jgi:hypothetical protein